MSDDQTLFRAALMNPEAAVPAGLQDALGRAAGRRFNVYRNNVAYSLTEALHQGFPVLARILGVQNMNALAAEFLRAHPPQSPLMMHYGAALPDYLAQVPQLANAPYLPDLARLELALRRSYHAADAAPIPPEALAIEPELLLKSRLELAPAAELIRSDWPIFGIWHYHSTDGAPEPAGGAEDVLITRPEFDPVPVLLPPGGADWIAALGAGHTIGAAHDAALSSTPDFDLGATLGLLLQGGVLTSLKN